LDWKSQQQQQQPPQLRNNFPQLQQPTPGVVGNNHQHQFIQQPQQQQQQQQPRNMYSQQSTVNRLPQSPLLGPNGDPWVMSPTSSNAVTQQVWEFDFWYFKSSNKKVKCLTSGSFTWEWSGNLF